MLFLAANVDDIVLARKSQRTIAKVKAVLGKHFRVKDMGKLLGVNVKQNFKAGRDQPSYAQNVLEKFGLENCKPAATPVATGTKLLKATADSELFYTTFYQSSLGMLLYLSGWTRPDITFAVSNVSRFCSKPTKEHWVAVKYILRYMKGTVNYGLMYSNNDENDKILGC